MEEEEEDAHVYLGDINRSFLRLYRIRSNMNSTKPIRAGGMISTGKTGEGEKGKCVQR